MKLFIAEKPKMARAIARELGTTGKGDGFIQCGGDITVTWCRGHMLEQAEPDEYTPDEVPRGSNGKKVWRVDELPIIPSDWILQIKDDTKKQLAVIGKLLKKAHEVVNAGDPDREGQLLVDEVLEHFHDTKPVYRFLSSGFDSVSVKRGLDAINDNASYVGWADAARARGRADWLIGMNLSRAYTLRAQRGGSRVLLTVGRVQTPTLNLVVTRDREIEAFKPAPYHTIRADIQHSSGGTFSATWKAKEDQEGLDSEGRLVDSAIANALVTAVTNKPGTITEYKQEAKKQNQPLVLKGTDITVIASSKYGYTAEDVLNTCQALYETHELTTYPRTDCAHLPESQHADAADTLDAIKHVMPDLAGIVDGADPRIKSKTWDDSKITAHHGIIPTMHKGNAASLSDMDRNIYDLIVRAYIAQFYSLHEFMKTTVAVEVVGEDFAVTGKVVTRNGWRDVFQDNDEDAKQDQGSSDKQALPAMAKGDAVTCAQVARNDSKTKAPSRFTEGTLLLAMENIHRFVTEPEHKKMLRDGDGIGTPATRPSILSELKRREFLVPKGKQIISTTLGRSMIDALPEVIKSPVLTALYERMLKGIELGSAELSAFLAKQEAFVRDQVTKANNGAVAIAGGTEAVAVSTVHMCKACGAGLSRRPTKKKGHYWWGCSHYPSCKQTYPDIKGRPNYNKGRSNDDSDKE